MLTITSPGAEQRAHARRVGDVGDGGLELAAEIRGEGLERVLVAPGEQRLARRVDERLARSSLPV